ncbi:hypothetical protein [Microbulbifer guangxiensis]|uniref:hypothetical protein n=1 Tax=Microbulbifer guangxiensis TaxID=2904249 RepID=UPI001F3C7990|nr:hypothetical protein [Microbulbifer guangxiensis]
MFNEAAAFSDKSDCLKTFFKFLEDRGLKYCVVGDSTRMPVEVPSDIDIVVESDSLRRINGLIREFCLNYDLAHVQTLHHEQSAYYYVLAFVDKSGTLDFLHPDVCGDYFRRGRKLLNSEDLLIDRVVAVDEDGSSKNFYVATPHQEFIYYFIKKIDKGAVNSSQFDHLRRQYLLAVEDCKKMLRRFWSEECVNEVSRSLSSGDQELLKSMVPALKRELAEGKKFHFVYSLREFFRQMGRVLRPTGISVALLGPDGAGKTAVGDGLVEKLSPAFRKVSRFHLRPYCLGNPERGSVVADPHNKKPRGILSSIAKLVYFLADYLIGWVAKILPLKIHSNFVIFDRYYHDLLVDPKRYRYSAPRWLSRLVSKIVPKPDLFIVLDAPTEMIQLRKREVPHSETDRQRKAYLKFAKGRQDCIVLNTAKPLESTMRDSCDAVLRYMQARERKRQRAV